MSLSRRLRFEILRRDDFRCTYCGATPQERELRVDHVIPETLGGLSIPENLVTSCDPCNSGKASIAPDSAMVAAVDKDALRWATAMRIVAEGRAADADERAELRDHFASTWSELVGKVGVDPLWRATIDGFHDRGLSPEDILTAVTAAAKANHVPPKARWTYFCKVGWNIAREIREQARQVISVQDACVGLPDPWATPPAGIPGLDGLDGTDQ